MIDTQIGARVRQVQAEIAAACDRAGRDPSELTLVAVSKRHPVEAVLAAAEVGLTHFGENRVEEASDKIPAVTAQTDRPLVWHMIGHIQSRKARLIPALFQHVQSVDSLKLAEKFSRLMVEAGTELDVMMEVNISGEAAKYGFTAHNWSSDPEVRQHLWDELRQVFALPGLRVSGLMTMAPIVSDMQETRPIFADLRHLSATLRQEFDILLPDLSMGMTDDYPVAIEEGATIVRVGRAIFGPRD